MLASVYSYRVMVKSVSSCCVRGRRVLSDPVTNIEMVQQTAVRWVKQEYGITTSVTSNIKQPQMEHIV